MTDNLYPLFTVSSKRKIIFDRMISGRSGLIHSIIIVCLISLLIQTSIYIDSVAIIFLLIAAVIFVPYIIHAVLIIKTKLGYAVFHENSAEIIAGSQTHNLIYGSEIELKLTAHVIIGGAVIYYTAEIIYNQNGVNKRISMLTDQPGYFNSLSRLFRIKNSGVKSTDVKSTDVKSSGVDNLHKTTVEAVREEDRRVVISPPFKTLTKGARRLSVFFNIISGILFLLIISVYGSLFAKGSVSLQSAKDLLVIVIVILIIFAAAFLIRLSAGIHYSRRKKKTASEIIIADDLPLSGISVNGKVFPKESISEISVIRAASSGRLYLEIKTDSVQQQWLLGKENPVDPQLLNVLSVLCGDKNSHGAVKNLLGIDVQLKQI